MTDSRTLGTGLLGFTVDTLTALAAHHFPDWRLPNVFAGHRVDADVRADLLFTLTHLAAGGVPEICDTPVDDVIAALLTGVDGRATHTFFSYRVAETLLRHGPFADNKLLRRCDAVQREQVALAVDSRDWIELLAGGALPRNYAAVLSRCEAARVALGLADDAVVLDDLIGRLRALLDENPGGYLDDSVDRSGRYDIYTADLFLFCEPLASRLGEAWDRGARTALALVDTVAGPDGAAIPWGRSTGVLATALTIELGALAVLRGEARAGAWTRRAMDARRAAERRFGTDGVIDAHRFRNQDAYRGPARRLQLTLDVLGKLAWAGATFAAAPGVDAAGVGETYARRDELLRFETERAAAAWVHRSPGCAVVVPFVGPTRSHYLPAAHAPGTFEVPVDNEQVTWSPLVVSGGHPVVAGGLPDELRAAPGRVEARWASLRAAGRDAEGAAAKARPGRCVTTYTAEGRTVVVTHDLALDDPADAIALQIPETARAPLTVEFRVDAPHAITTIDVDGVAEWSSPFSGLRRVHQVDVDPTDRVRITARVTPKLRVASTAFGHWYDRLLYTPMRGRVHELAAPIGVMAEPEVNLDDVELLHLHWPEWFGFDDPATHAELVATLATRAIPVVWTAHNLTPHDRRPEVYDSIYQQWAGTVAGVVHHTAWGRDRMLARYRFRSDCEHVVLPHGHFGELWADAPDRAEAERALGLTPARLRIGLVGAPRADKRVDEFLAGVAASDADVRVACWSLLPGERAPEDPRIEIAERYHQVDPAVYAMRLAACDAIALPFDPAGDMLATGTVADAIGLGLPVLVSEWPFLTEMLGEAGIPVGHTADTIAAALGALTDVDLAAARAAMAALRPRYEWAPIADATYALFERVVLRGAHEEAAASPG